MYTGVYITIYIMIKKARPKRPKASKFMHHGIIIAFSTVSFVFLNAIS